VYFDHDDLVAYVACITAVVGIHDIAGTPAIAGRPCCFRVALLLLGLPAVSKPLCCSWLH